ncbi:GNAT family N-acetyltransferase [Erysipelothrix rhusiopathiae]|uniref:GNAT family N-acetyltransferase n=1 Tax=Erysipelothrix rhusiopathiae TaxID=1648 RepID=UPI00202ACC33|nr:GNAT family N-acetyltransferase [Erysipelothrix rhusiopathiae]MDE8032811.1 GNAT family N-acetyltransferase [Erysipelothrix rhusiopathiae]MDE8037291.1 GNAT family N-acetyltransferase [Erysipelothrix rhusiopathiae]MDE8039930.1 GNAT family N-acetyltransferase [Erysipelothrix rhusiopathiae]MDE8041346.1 GNAT family N-acetyltransferase [Erysipelothrix rhusiopathiae]MDE8043975.1 GNAT family N-acetyltransferase [Erysipelothrix rhusiopathiae]
MIIYRYVNFETLDEFELEALINLSIEWDQEQCSTAYSANTKDYYKDKELFLAADETKIIGYALGTIKTLSQATSYNQVGEQAFELDELFVSKPYRNQKVGQGLFKFVEERVASHVDLIGVIANASDYQKLLSLYVEDLGMDFKHALLIKRTR